MWRPRLILSFSCLALAALCLPPAAHAVTSSLVKVPTNFVDDSLVTGFNLPRAFTFLPDGRLLVMEHKTAKIRLVVNNHIATTDPITTVTNVNTTGYERGTQGIAIDPRWPVQPYVYVFHNGADGFNHLIRYTASGQITNATAESIVLGSKREIISNIPDVDPNHQAGCLRFGPDGMLYVSLGEDEQWCLAQDSTSLRGAILRIDVRNVPAGAGAQPPRGLIIPAGNPLSTPDSNAKLVWAYGFRNPWIFGIDEATGTIFAGDVGEADEEELDMVLPGRNYGWPYREGLDTVLPRTNCPEPNGAGSMANGWVDPIVAYHRDTAMHSVFTLGAYRAVQGGTANWPAAYRGMVFWGDYYYGDLHRIQKDEFTGGWYEQPVTGQPGAYWGTGFKAAVDFHLGPDASLYWLQQISVPNLAGTNGTLHRIRYTGATVDVPAEVSDASRLQFSPNPFRDRTELAFRLVRAAHVKLDVFDVLGRHVASLLDGDAPAGESRVAWTGERVAPGLYLARLQTDGRNESARVLRLR